MSMLSVKNLDEKALNYAVITVTPEARVTLRGDSKNIRHLGCNRFQILLGAAVYLAISNSKGEVVHAGLVDELILLNSARKDPIKDQFEEEFNLIDSSSKLLFSFKRIQQMKNIAILQPSELGSDFNFSQENGVWGVNFPAAVESDVNISQNTNNLIKVGTDGGAYVDATKLIAHALVQDNDNQKIHLYRFPAGTVFNKLTATLVGSVDMVELNGAFDDIAIVGNKITFKDTQTSTTLTLDTDTLQRVSRISSTNSISAMTSGGNVSLDVIINPAAGNLLEYAYDGEGFGLAVSALKVSEYLDLLIAGINSQQSVRIDVAEGEVVKTRTIGKQGIKIPQLAFVGSAGQHLAYTDDVTTPLTGYTVPAV